MKVAFSPGPGAQVGVSSQLDFSCQCCLLSRFAELVTVTGLRYFRSGAYRTKSEIVVCSPRRVCFSNNLLFNVSFLWGCSRSLSGIETKVSHVDDALSHGEGLDSHLGKVWIQPRKTQVSLSQTQRIRSRDANMYILPNTAADVNVRFQHLQKTALFQIRVYLDFIESFDFFKLEFI